jgi:hypothetical protein
MKCEAKTGSKRHYVLEHLNYKQGVYNPPPPPRNTGYTQKNGAVSKVNKKFISDLTRAQRTSSTAAALQVSHALTLSLPN